MENNRYCLIDHLIILQKEVQVLEQKIQPHATGHIITTVNVLRDRISELSEELRVLEKQYIWSALNDNSNR